MPQTVTKNAIDIFEIRFYKQSVRQEDGSTVEKWFGSVGYQVQTAEGETWTKTFDGELSGAIKTDAQSLYTKIKTAIENQEGVV